MKAEKKGEILIVDDEEFMQDLIDRILRKDNYSCCRAANVPEAKALLKQQPFDLVLSDIRMPGESGLDLCQYIKSEHPGTAVMLITAADDMDTANKAISMDIYGYILKPITVSQLLISVANAIRRHQLEIWDRSYRERLETMVHERTSDLLKMNEDLKAHENELRELNAALGILLRKIAQEKKSSASIE